MRRDSLSQSQSCLLGRREGRSVAVLPVKVGQSYQSKWASLIGQSGPVLPVKAAQYYQSKRASLTGQSRPVLSVKAGQSYRSKQASLTGQSRLVLPVKAGQSYQSKGPVLPVKVGRVKAACMSRLATDSKNAAAIEMISKVQKSLLMTMESL
ncbi:hypothetical protein J6590_051917 [Homalodisca vitripennis]|nr:hypothetical protein J6590_051917 [Homalodisca vitripennis]